MKFQLTDRILHMMNKGDRKKLGLKTMDEITAQGEKGKGMTGLAFVRQKLLKNDGDPDLGCDEDGKLIEFAWAFLTDRLPPEWIALCELHHELKERGIDLPKVQLGQSLRGRLV